MGYDGVNSQTNNMSLPSVVLAIRLSMLMRTSDPGDDVDVVPQSGHGRG